MESYYLVEKGQKQSLPFNVREFNCHRGDIPFKLHNHSALEIIAVTQGELTVTANEQAYTLCVGDVCLFDPYMLHHGEVSDKAQNAGYICFTVNLDGIMLFVSDEHRKHLQMLLSGLSGFECFYPSETDIAIKICKNLKKLNNIFRGEDIYAICNKMSLMYDILGSLFEKCYCVKKEKYGPEKRNVQFMQSVSKFVSENYKDPNISTPDIAAHLYMSQDHFCHVFRKIYGMPFLRYLCRFRVNHAAMNYKGTKKAISDIAFEVGFSDYCYFSRSFKQVIGVSPARYFGKWRGQ